MRKAWLGMMFLAMGQVFFFPGLKRYAGLKTPELTQALGILEYTGLLEGKEAESNFVATINYKKTHITIFE